MSDFFSFPEKESLCQKNAETVKAEFYFIEKLRRDLRRYEIYGIRETVTLQRFEKEGVVLCT